MHDDTSALGAAPRRRRGRPRLARPSTSEDPREEILEAAGKLFSTQGYAGTGTREIASVVGLEQPSLFHWFARKEDILAELLDRTVAPALAETQLLHREAGPPEVRLCALALRDVRNLCSGPVNLAALQLLPEARNPAFSGFWARRDELRDRYRRLLFELGVQKRALTSDIDLATALVFGLVESVITWYERDGSMGDEAVAQAVAIAVVRTSVVPPLDAVGILDAADALLKAPGG